MDNYDGEREARQAESGPLRVFRDGLVTVVEDELVFAETALFSGAENFVFGENGLENLLRCQHCGQEGGH